ncbi:MAG: TIGR04086 family membrane protein [Clostridia bacterium]|nr:TIGR04086 family membrane protein [Clostridia bacterium]
MSVYRQKCSNAGFSLTLLRPVVIGVSVGALATLLIILIASALFSVIKSFADNLAVPLAVLAATAGAFAGGFIAARIFGCKGLLIGLVTGFFLFAIIFIISAICASRLFTTAVLAQFIFMTLGGAAGGFCAVNTKRKR